MTGLQQIRLETYIETAEYADILKKIFIPGTGLPKAALITVDNGKIIINTLSANDAGIAGLTLTKILERVIP